MCTPDGNVLIELITVQLSLSNDLIFLYNLSTDINVYWISNSFISRFLVHYIHRVHTNNGCWKEALNFKAFPLNIRRQVWLLFLPRDGCGSCCGCCESKWWKDSLNGCWWCREWSCIISSTTSSGKAECCSFGLILFLFINIFPSEETANPGRNVTARRV